ncbi:4Fe-4S binding protein [Oceanirhabdus seepicola]|uniref:4Fe-4S binding protein n=1 Tax=Oceanirhabdus seepicola TaxID=2828781 RepID=A0A9J6PAM0_9CLOT|nr:4Fe-4S binding protein [Oceanirhabdus seepicola]MCM1992240.1 4Fe-4S binding protein [Oceanirhabdus seepicola]
MKKAVIDTNKCHKCIVCSTIKQCPVNAITQERKYIFKVEHPMIDQNKCVGCGKCASVCRFKKDTVIRIIKN